MTHNLFWLRLICTPLCCVQAKALKCRNDAQEIEAWCKDFVALLVGSLYCMTPVLVVETVRCVGDQGMVHRLCGPAGRFTLLYDTSIIGVAIAGIGVIDVGRLAAKLMSFSTSNHNQL